MPKSLLFVAILFLFCVSCTRYQYSTISSPDLEKNEKNEFVVENDSLKLVYNFYGWNLGVSISIQNKLNVPVYIDWQRSALIVNETTYSYAPGEMRIDGKIQGSSYNSGYSGYGVTDASLHASASLPSTIDFMPPRSSLTKTPLILTRRYLSGIPDSALHKTKYTPVKGVTVSVKEASFTRATSPLRFRSFITYMVAEPGSRPLTIEHSFYVSGIMNAMKGPSDMMKSGDHGDRFFTSKATQGGQFGAALGVMAIIGGLILVVENNNNTTGGN